jgi:hypothetical protein
MDLMESKATGLLRMLAPLLPPFLGAGVKLEQHRDAATRLDGVPTAKIGTWISVNDTGLPSTPLSACPSRLIVAAPAQRLIGRPRRASRIPAKHDRRKPVCVRGASRNANPTVSASLAATFW